MRGPLSQAQDSDSQQYPSYLRTSFDPTDKKMRVKTLTHDCYILELPQNRENSFYKQFGFYLEEYDYKGKRIEIAPVARIYGTNQFGQKCCCHIHGYFPHFYIKAGQFSEAFTHDRAFLRNFLALLEGLYQRAYSINKPIIMNAVAQQKMDFYGYHQRQQTFLKIIVYDPGYILKLRQLLDSQIVGGRIFQCYEAHLNYFMQLFTDHNIYGINELSIIQYTFRRNLNSQMMDLFRKLNTKTRKLYTQGYNLIELESKHPEMFNQLEKISSCYIQIDLATSGILNSFTPQYQMMNSEEKSIDSEMEVQDYNLGDYKMKFQVKITKALKQIWDDQSKRRKFYGIEQMPEGIIDYSKNMQAKQNQQGSKDLLWVNFIKKGNNLDLMIEMIKSYMRGQPKKQSNQIQICRQIAQNYKEVLDMQKQRLIEKVLGRWRYYGSRKKNYLQQLMNGEKEELPEWEDDQESNSQNSENQSEQAEVQGQIGHETKSEAPKLKRPNNVSLYRNNYKHIKASLKKDSYFFICSYCKNIAVNCRCDDSKNQYESTQDTLTKSWGFLQTQQKGHAVRAKYLQAPPSASQVLQDAVLAPQKPYYSNFKDLFTYHKISPVFQPCLKSAQILDRELKIVKDYNREPITIKNELKFPYYFVPIMTPEIVEPIVSRPFVQNTYRIKYTVEPPSLQEVLKDVVPKPDIRPSGRRSTQIRPQKEDVFVSDLVILHYQFAVGFEQKCTRYCADPQKDQIVCFSMQTRNLKEYRRAFKSLILVEKYVKKQNLHVWQFDDIYLVKNEYDLLSMVISIICRLDPDFLVTFDQEKRGIRYLTQRGFAYGINFPSLVSRSNQLDELLQFINFRQFKTVKQVFLTRQILLSGNLLENKNKNKKQSSQLAYLQARLKKSMNKKPVLRQKYRFDIEIKGRVNVNLYRICEQQLKLESYTIENICRHLFNEQIPEFTDRQLFQFYTSPPKGNNLIPSQGTNFVIGYISKRLGLQAEIIFNLNIVSVLVEKSKIFGSDIVSMMERGSQFKIQAIMCRVTKKLGYLNLSASKRQVGNQSVLQCFALVLEPPKQFYTDPVLIFDFQSLYPSIMIAYNICYSTCLGSINNIFDKEKHKRLGVSQRMNIDVSFLEDIVRMCEPEEAKRRIQNIIFLTPNKIAYVKKSFRQGIIPRILLQFLITRIMIKSSQDLYKKAKIKKILKDRQYALKLFMNVLFGYTGASFTGRMPCSEIADSIVELSKYCLRQAIDFLNSHPKYKGKVIYGDTDSIFFQMPGYTINEAMKVGRQLALQITAMFPYPIQMKFQKVYDGLFLVAKKRYYGKMYESQTSAPKYEGKGLECVRRDGIDLTRNLMRQMLDNLIDNRDLSRLKQIFKQQSAKILNNQKLQSEFSLAKEVKLLKYGQKTCPAHGQAAKRLQKFDPMMMPKYGQRMKYLVINGGLKPVKSRSIPMFEYLSNKNMSLDLNYYFRKQVLPPIQRVLSSLADLNEWSASIEYRHSFQFSQSHQLQVNKKCLHCHGQTCFILCQKCLQFVDEQIRSVEQATKQAVNICRECTGCQSVAEANKCVEWNCRQLWNRRNVEKARRNIDPELKKLKGAIKQLNF